MASSSQRCRSVRGYAHAAPLLSALVSALALVGCQADINGSGKMPDGSVADPGTGPGPGPMNVDEPSDWFGAVDQTDCSKPGELARSRIRRLSNAQWKNTVTQALGANVTSLALPPDAVSSTTGFDTDAVVNKVNVLLANA